MAVPKNCLCKVQHERNWDESYGYFTFQAWMVDALLSIDVVHKAWNTVLWPANALFAAPAAALASRPRVVYRILLELLNATMRSPRDEYGAKLAWNGHGDVRSPHETLGLAHAMERSWFLFFDRSYEPW